MKVYCGHYLNEGTHIFSGGPIHSTATAIGNSSSKFFMDGENDLTPSNNPFYWHYLVERTKDLTNNSLLYMAQFFIPERKSLHEMRFASMWRMERSKLLASNWKTFISLGRSGTKFW